MKGLITDVPKELHIHHANSCYGVNRETRRNWGIHFKRKKGSGITKKAPTARHRPEPTKKSLAIQDAAMSSYRAYFAAIPIPKEYQTKKP